MHKLFFIFLSVICISSCSTMSKSFTARTQNINKAEIVQNPLLADLVVKDEKVSGTATGKSMYKETVKQEAIANALKGLNADVLIEPAYEIATISDKITVTVTGRPAFYKNFRTIKSEDIELIQKQKAVNLETNITKDSSQSKAEPEVKQKKKGKVLGVIACIVLPIFLISSLMQ